MLSCPHIPQQSVTESKFFFSKHKCFCGWYIFYCLHRFLVLVNPFAYKGITVLQSLLCIWGLGFLQWCCWKFRFSRMWWCVVGWAILTLEQSFEISGTNHLNTCHKVPENVNLFCPYFFMAYFLLFQMYKQISIKLIPKCLKSLLFVTEDWGLCYCC